MKTSGEKRKEENKRNTIQKQPKRLPNPTKKLCKLTPRNLLKGSQDGRMVFEMVLELLGPGILASRPKKAPENGVSSPEQHPIQRGGWVKGVGSGV